MAPLISVILPFLASIPKLIQAVKLIKPIKEKVLEVETEHRFKSNEDKHALVLTFLTEHLLPRISKYGFDEYDLDTMIRFVVLFIRKVKRLRQYKPSKKLSS